ncbi:hypothetical protein [Dyella subtropica]|uniref:hypothetical protein n=1 Tax=Dyella subtropica TaxID=2992127 RepID=UPI00225A2646|nr:hypothetical protein [Dyella subtropica]
MRPYSRTFGGHPLRRIGLGDGDVCQRDVFFVKAKSQAKLSYLRPFLRTAMALVDGVRFLNKRMRDEMPDAKLETMPSTIF